MNEILISNYTANFTDFDNLFRWATEYPGETLGVEMAGNWFDEGYIPALDAQIERFRSLSVTIHGPYIEMCTVPGSEAERKVELELEHCCALYHRFGAKSIVLHTHLKGVAPEKRTWAQGRIVEFLSRWIRRMTGEGMAVTVENVGYPKSGSDLFTQAEFVALFDKLPPEAGCLIDIGHAFLNGWDVPGLIRTLGTRIKGYHMNNNDGIGDTHIPIYGENGVCNPAEMDEIIRTIGEITPDADIILEYAPYDYISQELIHSDIRAILERLK